MNFRKQNLIVCPERSSQFPPSECLPFIHFKEQQQETLDFFDLDGYTIDFRAQKATALFMKREFSIDPDSEINEEILKENFLQNADISEVNNQISLSETMSIPLFLTVWPYDYPQVNYDELEEKVFIFDIRKENGNIVLNLLKMGDKDSLQMFIKKYRGFSFTKYVKPLVISKSYMECHLSRTPDPWPGDMDGIIKFKHDPDVKGLFEFKTHNLSTPITQEDINKYGPQDLRRFKVLFYLQRQIENIQNNEPPIFFIVWGTNPQHDHVKLQILSKGKVIEEILVKSSNDEKYSNLLEKIVEYIS